MKRLAVSIICCAMGFLSFSQDRCGFMPISKDRSDQFEDWMKTKQARKNTFGVQGQQRQTEVYQIPIVFHIIHQGETVGFGDNIPDSRILEQVDILNEDFRKMNRRRDTGVPSVFQDVEADIEVEFVLAKQDPNGLPTNGIVRVQGSQAKYSNDFVKSFSYWPSEDYLNVWVANTYPSIYGWATWPNTDLPGDLNGETDPAQDGVVVDSEYIGINPLASGEFESFGQTLTHEIGHFLGLIHVWGDGNCSEDDFCEDTPAAGGNNGGLSNCSYPGPDSCPEDTFADMFMNFMDYSDDQCMAMFTEDQKSRIRTVLENSPRRLSLRTSLGLQEPSNLNYDLAISEVQNFPLFTCENEITPQIRIRNLGTETVNSFNLAYSFNGVSNNQMVTGLSLELGDTYDVNLAFSITSENQQDLELDIISVNGEADQNSFNSSRIEYSYFSTKEIAAPFKEDFESSTWITNSTEGISDWQYNSSINDKSMRIEAFQNSNDLESWIVSPSFSLEDFQEVGLFFKSTYGIPSSNSDFLRVMVASECTGDFIPVYGRSLEDLNYSESTNKWTAGDKDEWLETFIDLTDFAGESSVRIAFAFTNYGGNDFYLDDIELTNNNDRFQPRLKEGRFVLYPNPTRDQFNLTLNLLETQNVVIEMVDISGKTVFRNTYNNMLNQTLEFETAKEYGTYFIRVTGKNINQTQRILIGR